MRLGWEIGIPRLSSSVERVLRPSSLRVKLGNGDVDDLRLVRPAETHFHGLDCYHLADQSHQSLNRMHQKMELEVAPCSYWVVQTDCDGVMRAASEHSPEPLTAAAAAVAGAVAVAAEVDSVEETGRRLHEVTCLTL